MCDTKKTVSEMLIDTVNATGGIAYGGDGNPYPLGDPDWIDLADVYLAACQEAGVAPKVVEDELFQDNPGDANEPGELAD